MINDELVLNPDGPHSPENTVNVADLMAQAARVLVYATEKKSGLQYPSHVYALLGELYTGTGRLRELVGNLDRFLTREHDAGYIGISGGGDPAKAVAAAQLALEDAARHAAALTTALQAAQEAISLAEYRQPQP